jgi:periodic tryptophan protein 1
MALSWNPFHKQVIASGSADTTVKLWDVTKAGTKDFANCNASTFTHHRNKVQAVAWNPKEGTLLASGSFDRTISILDARSSGSHSNVKSVKIEADCEALAWDPFHSERLTVVSEDGMICCWDVRKFETSKPIWSFVASEFGGVSDLCYNSQVPGLMVTCSIDKHVSLWDTHVSRGEPNGNGWSSPRLCGKKDMCSGKLYSVSFYPSSPWVLGCGGSGNQLALWDLSSEDAIQKRFQSRMSGDEISKEVEISDPKAAEDLQAVITPAPLDDASRSTQKHATENSDKRIKKKGKSNRKIHKKSR